MRIAILARPQWEAEHAIASASPRIIHAPLQQLEACKPPMALIQSMAFATSPWVVFTSPASVQAMDRWIEDKRVNPMQQTGLRLAAVGSGTRQAIAEMQARHQASPSRSWPLEINTVVVSEDDERADAASLLRALDACHEREHFAWQDQSFFIAQGDNNRPTLADGLKARGATVAELILYRRVDVPWADSVWKAIGQSQPGQCGVVVTSSTVIARLMADLDRHGVDRAALIWCTQHATIAEKLRGQGIARIRRVALSLADLEKDLFEHELYW